MYTLMAPVVPTMIAPASGYRTAPHERPLEKGEQRQPAEQEDAGMGQRERGDVNDPARPSLRGSRREVRLRTLQGTGPPQRQSRGTPSPAQRCRPTEPRPDRGTGSRPMGRTATPPRMRSPALPTRRARDSAVAAAGFLSGRTSLTSLRLGVVLPGTAGRRSRRGHPGGCRLYRGQDAAEQPFGSCVKAVEGEPCGRQDPNPVAQDRGLTVARGSFDEDEPARLSGNRHGLAQTRTLNRQPHTTGRPNLIQGTGRGLSHAAHAKRLRSDSTRLRGNPWA